MLEHIHIEKFRCLRDVDVPLRPLTVLVGPNDSGKSAFLRAFRFLGGDVDISRMDWWRLKENAVRVTGRASGEKFTRRGDGGWKPAAAQSYPFLPLQFFQLPSHGVNMKSEGYADEGDPPMLDSSGGMIPALLDHLLRRDRQRYDSIVDTLRGLIEGFEGLHIGTPSPATRSVDLVIDNGLRIPADEASVGVRLLLFFVTLAYHPTPPKLVLIEEPENGVHPKRLADVMQLLREISQGKHGDHASQVILTTHSPHLLDYVDLEHDQVLVFSREKDGSRTAHPADAERLKHFLDEFMLGEVWYNEGEAGLVGSAE